VSCQFDQGDQDQLSEQQLDSQAEDMRSAIVDGRREGHDVEYAVRYCMEPHSPSIKACQEALDLPPDRMGEAFAGRA